MDDQHEAALPLQLQQNLVNLVNLWDDPPGDPCSPEVRIQVQPVALTDQRKSTC